eukprot:IDg3416t1
MPNHVKCRRLIKGIELVKLLPERMKQIASKATQYEQRLVRSLAGNLRYIGTTVSPLASFAASFLQQMLPQLTIAGIKFTNRLVKDIIKRTISITYLTPNEKEKKQARIAVFSDAVGWLSRKQRRASSSSGQAEVIAAVTGIGCALNHQTVMNNTCGVSLPITLVVDSLGLH